MQKSLCDKVWKVGVHCHFDNLIGGLLDLCFSLGVGGSGSGLHYDCLESFQIPVAQGKCYIERHDVILLSLVSLSELHGIQSV